MDRSRSVPPLALPTVQSSFALDTEAVLGCGVLLQGSEEGERRTALRHGEQRRAEPPVSLQDLTPEPVGAFQLRGSAACLTLFSVLSVRCTQARTVSPLPRLEAAGPRGKEGGARRGSDFVKTEREASGRQGAPRSAKGLGLPPLLLQCPQRTC